MLSKFLKNPLQSLILKHKFTNDYNTVYNNLNLPKIYNLPINIKTHTKYLGMPLCSYNPYNPFDLNTLLKII